MSQEEHLTFITSKIEKMSIEAPKVEVEIPVPVKKAFRNPFGGNPREIAPINPTYVSQITSSGPLTIVPVEEVHKVDVKKSSGPSKYVSAAIAIAITCVTQRMDFGLVGTAVASATATQMTLATLNNDFDPVKGIKQTVSAEGLKSIGVSTVTNVIAGPAPGIKATIPQIVAHSGKSALVRGGLNVGLGRESFDEALKNAGTNFIFDVVGRVGANKIGSLYKGGKGSINWLEHKVLHAGAGAVLGGLKGDVTAGALGAMVAEIVAEAVKDDEVVIQQRVMEKAEAQGIAFGSERYQALVSQELRSTIDWSKLGATIILELPRTPQANL